MQQLEFTTHGGRRRGAGRPTTGRVSHAMRPRFARPTPAHVTLRVGEDVWNLRRKSVLREIRACFAAALGRFGLRLIEFSILGNHLHLIVEADDTAALSRGMQGLTIRIAKALNRLMSRRGTLFADHYHARLLTTPAELVNAIAYVLENAARRYGASGPDAFSSAAPNARLALAVPVSWLLTVGWRRAKRIPDWMLQRQRTAAT
ncbi:MAG: transposase [Myxococcales bacterium]|nr:transposase [Myxococcales bacterium]